MITVNRVAGWVTKHDPLFGPFRERVVTVAGGRCHSCGGDIGGGSVFERERGGVVWLAHYPECPTRPGGNR